MKRWMMLGVAMTVLAAMTACVQMPTEKQGVSDLRPQISFVAPAALSTAVVYVDGLEVGRVGDFLDGQAALRILPGTHTVRVVADGRIVLDERFYVGDGVSRAFTLQ